MTNTQLATLVPMSREDLRSRKMHNIRRPDWCNLYFVDGAGAAHMLVSSEIQRFGLDRKYPTYLLKDAGIREINQARRAA
jgi:hypothetical protein